MSKQIYFHETDDQSVSMLHGYKETHEAIHNDNINVVHTTQMALLCFDLVDCHQYRIFVVFDNQSYKIVEFVPGCRIGAKELRVAHNLLKMYMSTAMHGVHKSIHYDTYFDPHLMFEEYQYDI